MKTVITTAAAVLLLVWGVQALAGETKKSDTKKAPYPLKTCVVSGDSLDAMGEPYVYEHKGQEVRFCCKECLPKFNEDPDKYVAMLKEGKAGSMEHGNHSH